MNARAAAFHLLQRWSQSRALADELLDEIKLPAPDRAFAQELFYGCLRHKLALEYLIRRHAEKPPRPLITHILLLGLYQLHHLRVPPHAAVHETVELAKQHASPAEARFVNALLRRVDFAALADAEPWVRLSHPRWLWQRHGDAWCEWNNQPPPLYARVNTLRAPPRDPIYYRIEDPTGLFDSPAWKNGEIYLQDPSTLAAVDLLDPQPGEEILDMCAAPGGKTTYLAQKMQNRGRILAADSSNSRLGLVTENCRRLGVEIVATLACDGTRLDRCLRGQQFDRVLLDAPCSNTGVLRRRPDLRWRLREPELARLAQLQRRLLEKAFTFLKPGGVLVYSTCSLEPEENRDVIAGVPGLETIREIIPPRDPMDGAFVARFRRSR